MFHPLSPLPRQWKTLVPVVTKALSASHAASATASRGLEDPKIKTKVVEYSAWLDLLRAKLGSLDDDALKEKLLADFPAIKLFDFFEDTLIVKGKDQAPRPLSIHKALGASPSLRQLQAIKDEWMEGWVRAWTS